MTLFINPPTMYKHYAMIITNITIDMQNKYKNITKTY